jgi:hypothetical protein
MNQIKPSSNFQPIAEFLLDHPACTLQELRPFIFEWNKVQYVDLPAYNKNRD